MLSTQADMVNAIISLGKTLLLAKDELGHGNFKAMVEHKTRFKLRTAELYMQIASNAYLANAQHVATLPPYVGTLGVLSSWKPTALEAAAKNGHLTPDLDRAKAKELSEQYGPPKAITARPAATTPAPDPDPEPEPEPVDDEGFAVMPDGSGQVRMKNKSGRALIGTRMPSGRVVVGGKLPERFTRPVARTVKELADLLAQEKPDDGVLLYIDHLAIIGDSSGTGITIPLGYDPEDET
jgi:hypothetical protein